MMRLCRIVRLGLIVLLPACSPQSESDVQVTQRSLKTVKVAAVQYGEGDYSKVDPACSAASNKDQCALMKLVEQAANQGAVLVVTPENENGQQYLEQDPDLGDDPVTSSKWDDTELITLLSKTAKSLGIHIVTHLQTKGTSGSTLAKYSAQVALGPDGKVVGKHHKFELYGGEKKSFEPGTSVMTFDTPAGKVGMLICADIYGDLRKNAELTKSKGARVIALSSWWTVPDGTKWQESYAKNWGVYVAASNTTYSSGRGGGIYDPSGKALAKHTGADPAITIAEIPAP